MVRTFAAIDVGSFELELGIYEITDKGNVRTVDQVKHMIALGKDTYNTGKSATVWWKKCARYYRTLYGS